MKLLIIIVVILFFPTQSTFSQVTSIHGSWHSTDSLLLPTTFTFNDDSTASYTRGNYTLEMETYDVSEQGLNSNTLRVNMHFVIDGTEHEMCLLIFIIGGSEAKIKIFNDSPTRDGYSGDGSGFDTYKKN
ncbi:MAG: hypothetical protein OEW75_15275 [Cyclobacteriaceae bacterium]|nr:hypothetical protein [Cyclobacteriaceae bacterium]